MKVTHGLRLIVLNTVLYYEENDLVDKKDQDPGGQIAWLKDVLEKAKNDNEAVYIAGHIIIRGFGSFRSQYVEPLMKAMKHYQDIIKGSFWGHHHTDSFQLVGDTPENSHVGHLCGSIDTETNRNPTFRRYIVDLSNKFTITSWRTFYADLPESNKAGKIKWKTLYDSKKDYGLEELTPSSIDAFMTELKKNKTLFEDVWSHRYGDGPNGKCDDSCKKSFICSVLYTLPDDYEKCVKK